MARSKPTAKQKAFAQDYIKSKNGTQSALKHYNTTSTKTASTIASRNLNLPSVINYIEKILDKSGLDDEALAIHLHKIIVSGTSKHSLKKSQPTDALRGIEMAYRLRDKFPSDRVEKTEIKIQLQGKTDDELIKLLDDTTKEAKMWSNLLNKTKAKAIEGEEVKPS